MKNLLSRLVMVLMMAMAMTVMSVPVVASADETDILDGTDVIDGGEEITPVYDLTGITLAQSSVEGLITANSYYTVLTVDVILPEAAMGATEIPTSIVGPTYADTAYYNGQLVIYIYEELDTDCVVTIGDSTCPLHICVKVQGLSERTRRMSEGKAFTLKMLNYDGTVEFTSLQPDVARCNSKGKIRALKQGNAVIVATLEDGSKLGCVVSVVPTKIIKVCNKAIEIGATCTYSQPQRMEKGYYDCSSLTHRAYKSQKIYLCGSSGWAPTSRDQAKWCKKNKRLIKGSLSDNNVQKMKFLPGDLMFEYNVKGNFDSMYHVEMIVGYVVNGFDENGNPVLGIDYANRRPNYYPHGANQYVGRPYLDM